MASSQSSTQQAASDAMVMPEPETSVEEKAPSTQHTMRFWCVFLALCFISFVASMDATIVVTALPTIVREIGGEKDYIWIANSFIFASTVPQPLFAQISNVFGRRNPFMFAIIMFALGSGIAGGATSPPMLIAGRAIQGVGAGGTYVLLDVVLCDMVPLRERGKWLGLMLSTAAIGTCVGPVLGGAFALASWRWIFYMNLPFSGFALVFLWFFLKLDYTRNPTWKHALLRVDFLGNAILIPSLIAVLFGLTFGGIQYPWGSYHIIVPLVLGILGWISFHCYEATSFCKEPSMPPQLFTNRTSAAGFILTVISGMLLQCTGFFLSVYFQAVRGTSPLGAGINLLPMTVAVVPAAIGGGILMSKTGKYRSLHLGGMILSALGAGLFSSLKADSPTAVWAVFEIIMAFGGGIIAACTLPAILAGLSESDVATASGAFSFLRSFGHVWGVAIPSIVFNGQFNKHITRIGDADVQAHLANGAAYGDASGAYIKSLSSDLKARVIGVYVASLENVWQVMLAFALLGFLVVFIEKHYDLRKELDTEYGIQDKEKGPDISGEKGQNTVAVAKLEKASDE